MRPRPSFLAANIAMFASRSSRSGVSSAPSDSATPMLAVRNTSPVSEHDRLGECGSHALGDGDGIASVLCIVAHDRELVAAEARDRVARSQDALDALRDNGEQLVTGREDPGCH